MIMVCEVCGNAVGEEQGVCSSCAALAEREYRKRTLQVFALIGASLIVGAVALLYFVVGKSSSPLESARAAAGDSVAQIPLSSSRPAPSADTLPYLNQVQRAVEEALTPIRIGGRASVEELLHAPEKAAAIASIEFESFSYRADQAAAAPGATGAFSGSGSALMKFENGRWVVKSILIGQDLRTVEVQIR
jgi:predicted nucleic acid-binding Zn ribbon protein